MYVTVRTYFRAEARNPSPVGQAKPAVHDFKTCHHRKDYFLFLVLLLDNVTNTHTDSLLEVFLSSSTEEYSMLLL